ncbi:unnamed protein product [Heligmosomoides polygyrus]|uniref:SET domain-containing protein n=1 Tax=Heligmosomoides polygyrus TaxID=6339 RepID=A0A3P7Z0H7_HELPZ|nr:unnamed protein product [Heligmosomoides polygyrus]
MPLGGLDEALGYMDALRSTSLRVAAYSPDSLDAIWSELRKGASYVYLDYAINIAKDQLNLFRHQVPSGKSFLIHAQRVSHVYARKCHGEADEYHGKPFPLDFNRRSGVLYTSTLEEHCWLNAGGSQVVCSCGLDLCNGNISLIGEKWMSTPDIEIEFIKCIKEYLIDHRASPSTLHQPIDALCARDGTAGKWDAVHRLSEMRRSKSAEPSRGLRLGDESSFHMNTATGLLGTLVDVIDKANELLGTLADVFGTVTELLGTSADVFGTKALVANVCNCTNAIF